MANVVTTASQVTCGHQGSVQVESSAKLRVSGEPVLLKNSINGKSISSCATVDKSDSSGPTDIQCSQVSGVEGEATKLSVNGQFVMLETLSGQTDGMVGKVTPQVLLAATANQAKLTSI